MHALHTMDFISEYETYLGCQDTPFRVARLAVEKQQAKMNICFAASRHSRGPKDGTIGSMLSDA